MFEKYASRGKTIPSAGNVSLPVSKKWMKMLGNITPLTVG